MAAASGGALVVPCPWLVGEITTRGGGSSGFIVMDKVPMGGRRSAETSRAFGLGLAGESWSCSGPPICPPHPSCLLP